MIKADSCVKIIILIFIVLHSLVILNLSLLPFIDLPNHLAEATIYKFYGTTGNVIADYYQPVAWYFPNTFHIVFCSLFPDVEIGNKIFHMVCIAALHGSLFLLIRELGGNAWYGLLGMLFTYNYNLTYGFVGFAISIPTLFFLFYIILLDIRRERIDLKILIAFLLILLFLMHAQNALLGLLLFGLITLYAHRNSIGKILVRTFTIPLPLIIFIFYWWFTRDTQKEQSTIKYLADYYSSAYFREFLMRFRIVVFDNFQLHEGMAGIIIATSFFLCVFLPLVWFRIWKTLNWTFFKTDGAPYATLLLLTVLACYFFLPDKLPGQTPLFQRFCTMVMLSFIILSSLALNNVSSAALKYFVVLVGLIYSIFWIDYLYTFKQLNAGFKRDFFSGMDNRSKMAGLIYDNSYRGRKVYIHYPNYFLVWTKGIAASKIIDYRFGVVRRVAPESELPFYNELIGEGYRPISQYSSLDYLLVRGNAPVSDDVNLHGFTLMRESKPWKLYVNKNIHSPTQ